MPFGFGKGRSRKGAWTEGKGFRRKGVGPGRPPENCICPKCGMIVPHRRNIPCFQTKCSRCGSPMTRQFFYEE